MRRAIRAAAPVALLLAAAVNGCGGNGGTSSEGAGGAASSSGSGESSGSGQSSGSGAAPVTASCKDLLAAAPKTPDGVYDIDPDGAGMGAAFKVYCDMTTDGGGWTLIGTLKTTNADLPVMAGAWNGWSDDWWINPHGDATSPKNALTNHDLRKFKPLILATTILRTTTPASPVSRYHFGMKPDDWDLWNMGRYEGGVNVVGPFELPNVMVSKSLDLSKPVQAHLNGHWFNGVLAFGSAPLAGDTDAEGIGARFQTQSNAANEFGYAGDVRADTTFSFWLR